MLFVFSCVLLVLTLACRAGEPRAGSRVHSNCRPYEPAIAKRTFDGRVGSIIFHNDGPERVHVEVYHPDGQGPEISWIVPPRQVADLGGGFGNDWGIRAGSGCVTTLGQVGYWSDGRFIVDWRENSLSPGTPAAYETHRVAPEQNLTFRRTAR